MQQHTQNVARYNKIKLINHTTKYLDQKPISTEEYEMKYNEKKVSIKILKKLFIFFLQ